MIKITFARQLTILKGEGKRMVIMESEVDRFYKEEPMHRMYIGEVVDIIDQRI